MYVCVCMYVFVCLSIYGPANYKINKYTFIFTCHNCKIIGKPWENITISSRVNGGVPLVTMATLPVIICCWVIS